MNLLEMIFDFFDDGYNYLLWQLIDKVYNK